MDTSNRHAEPRPKRDELLELLARVKALASEYYSKTGRPLGVTGEVAEYEAARLLGLSLSDARQKGYDAVRKNKDTVTRIQIKGRCLDGQTKAAGRLGRIRLDCEWDSVVLVLMDRDFVPSAIWEAERPDVERALSTPGSRSRNERGALAIAQFKAIGRRVWPEH